MTRQQRRYEERRASKPEPGPISRTSIRWLGVRTKGQPYSRMGLEYVQPAEKGKPAVFYPKSYTRKSCPVPVKATLNTIDWFMRGVPTNMKIAMLG
jgi:hypothetical protein